MHATLYKSLGNTPPVHMKVICRMYMYHVISHVQHAQMMMMFPCWQQQILKAGKAVYMYVLNKLHWLVQIPQSKQYYHMGLS